MVIYIETIETTPNNAYNPRPSRMPARHNHSGGARSDGHYSPRPNFNPYLSF